MAGFYALLSVATSARELLELEGHDSRDEGMSSDGAVDVCSVSSPDRSSSPEGYESSTSASSSRGGKRRPAAISREQHNRLEKNRRAHQRSLLSNLKNSVGLVNKKASHLSVLQTAFDQVTMLKTEESELCRQEEDLRIAQNKLRSRLALLQSQLGPERSVRAMVRAMKTEDRTRSLSGSASSVDSMPSSITSNDSMEVDDEDEEIDIMTEDHMPVLPRPTRPSSSMASPTSSISSTSTSCTRPIPLIVEARAMAGNGSYLLMKVPDNVKVPFGLSSSQTLITVSPQQLKDTCSHAGMFLQQDELTRPVFPRQSSVCM